MNKKHLEELYNQALKDFDDKIRENESLKEDLDSLKNYNKRLVNDNYKLLEKVCDMDNKIKDLELEQRSLKRYIKTIQEYLCKGIFDMIKKEYEDGEDEFYED